MTPAIALATATALGFRALPSGSRIKLRIARCWAWCTPLDCIFAVCALCDRADVGEA